ncbi:ABC transporter ATP-binding protein [Nesterenkonia sp.]|uniref:ABC transporter ATP-binding protein n=1 Tax=Nesterenkonia sp. TaxID=704201 RepID=UPI00260E93C8|nr:ABC transporter ATP-binding protein [Nesterenkonia sp.]
MTEAIISAEALVKEFPGGGGDRVRAVDGVSLDFERGEIAAVLGPNGAGKTTLLDMVLGLTAPDAGRLTVFGGQPQAAVRAGRIGALLQTGGLLPDLTVKETVQIIAALHHQHAGIEAVMEAADLTEIASRKVGKCSGGQQQRVKFALALLPQPEVLILDEPTAGMDPAARHRFWDRMALQAEAGTTILFATHYLEEAEQFARRTVLMHGGRVIADGPTDHVRQHAGAAHITAIWQPTAGQLQQLPHVESHQVQGRRVNFRTTDSDALARHLLTATDAHSLTIRPASLEEAFMQLTTPQEAHR